MIFEDQGTKTLMTFRQQEFESAGERDSHQFGWGSCMDRFALYLQAA